MCLPLFADPWADAVISVDYGEGAGFGQDYFPDNVLGPPDTAATPEAASANPQEILSLGSGGSIILTFEDGGIMDEPGVDFTIFENPFYPAGSPNSYSETGIVALSEDGEDWIEYPYDPDSFEGLAGVTPVNGGANPLDPDNSGGDSFDLEIAGIQQAFYVRITDSEGLVDDNGPSFDLDAIAVIHGENLNSLNHYQTAAIPETNILQAYPNPFNSSLTVSVEGMESGQFSMAIFNSSGREVFSGITVENRFTWDAAGMANGIYYLSATVRGSKTITRRIVLLK
ncbi:T9SS type A sorting domain-containing protein [Calditrichota bacterium]